MISAIEDLLRFSLILFATFWLHGWSFLADSLTDALQNCTSALRIQIISAEVSDP
jgi:hypothetical protein